MSAVKQPESVAKHLLRALVIAVVFYVATFSFIQHRRAFKGPWEVAFVSDSAGRPSIFITQRTLHIFQKVQFPGERIAQTNLDVDVEFRESVTNLPFGDVVFQDPLYLPGSATMKLFGHTVELMPRVMVIDDKEVAWRSGKDIVVPRPTGVSS